MANKYDHFLVEIFDKEENRYKYVKIGTYQQALKFYWCTRGAEKIYGVNGVKHVKIHSKLKQS